ncbi:MAG: type IV pilus twitching motility protein PilT [Bdellovibrionaceae bacterium]|nr:type IV pilus twitching motility protein PilT [Bdellovibrionales bacterium]MCB9254321.1 type IV pilus twitching motility protein PilT [Pseudobdellovibrionaceae bacterium]
MKLTLPQLLKAMLEHKASDMHVTSGSPPSFRIYGKITKIKADTLVPSQTRELCYSVLTDYQKALFEENKELDFSFTIRELGRFRGNLFYQRGSVAGAFRHIPFNVPPLASLGLPPVVEQLVHKPKGLVLVTGAAGSGKTTTLASMINMLNQIKNLHIITIEDPIEYIYRHNRCLINQREVGNDTKSFAKALRSALREDPNIVLVGEMRDKETIETALMLAETGQLVLSTLHTNSASQTITRILNVFPAEQQAQVRVQLSLVLEGIVTQSLLPRQNAAGRVLACEIMLPNPSIRNLIRENKLHQLPSAMQVGQENTGMITFNQYLVHLVQSGTVSVDAALEATPDQEDLVKTLSELGRAA